MVSFKAARWAVRLAGLWLMASLVVNCSQQPEKSKIGNGGSANQGAGGTPVNEDPCYPSKKLALTPAPAGKLALASEAYEKINTAILKETCANNSCHGPESDFRPWVDNEENFKRVAARVRFRILNKNRRHYFKPDAISDENYRLLKAYVDSVPNSGLPAGCQVEYRP